MIEFHKTPLRHLISFLWIFRIYISWRISSLRFEVGKLFPIILGCALVVYSYLLLLAFWHLDG